jgi:hypothetical protein
MHALSIKLDESPLPISFFDHLVQPTSILTLDQLQETLYILSNLEE